MVQQFPPPFGSDVVGTRRQPRPEDGVTCHSLMVGRYLKFCGETAYAKYFPPASPYCRNLLFVLLAQIFDRINDLVGFFLADQPPVVIQ